MIHNNKKMCGFFFTSFASFVYVARSLPGEPQRAGHPEAGGLRDHPRAARPPGARHRVSQHRHDGLSGIVQLQLHPRWRDGGFKSGQMQALRQPVSGCSVTLQIRTSSDITDSQTRSVCLELFTLRHICPNAI